MWTNLNISVKWCFWWTLLLQFLECEANPKDFWPRRMVLDDDNNIHLSWKPDEVGIMFEIQARTKGYVALGFSKDGRMIGADIVVGWVQGDNGIVLQDMYASDHKLPETDAQQDYEFLWATRNETFTTFRFRRKYDTCDNKDLRITNDTIYLLYAYQLEEPSSDEPIVYHGTKRGSKSVRLLEPSKPDLPEMTSHVKTLDIRQPRIKIPENETTYWCKIFKLPEFNQKHQFIGYKPLIDKSDLVHHMILYECRATNSEILYEQHVKDGGHECYTANMPAEYSHCSTILASWGRGSQGDVLPPDVGIPLGGISDGSSYFMLEVHYENSRRKKDLIDSTGLRMYYTSNVRQYDASVLNIGHVVSPLQIIPPGIEKYVTVGHCSEECTNQFIPNSGITIYDVFLHAHSLTKSMKLRHLRNGVELTPIVNEQNFNPDSLTTRKLLQPVQILPGDHLLAECTYRTTNETKTIVGGLSLKQEMCLAFAHYYPRIPLSECQSWPAINLLTDWFNIKLGQQMNNFVVEEASHNQTQTLVEFLEHYQWGDRSSIYEPLIRYGAFMPFCLQAGRFPAQLTKVIVDYPRIKLPYYDVRAECTVNTSQYSKTFFKPQMTSSTTVSISTYATSESNTNIVSNADVENEISEVTTPKNHDSPFYRRTEVKNNSISSTIQSAYTLIVVLIFLFAS